MSNSIKNSHEAPIASTIALPAGSLVEFVFKVAELITVKTACLALRDFRAIGIENMRRLHANNKLIENLIGTEEIASEEQVIRDLQSIVYSSEASKMSSTDLSARTKELQKANQDYANKEHSIKLYTVSNAVFEESLKDESKFPKKMINQNQEVDTLIAYMDLCTEGIII